MALISFKDWRSKMTESSPMTRIRAGLPNQYPMPADVMSRSTPSPHVMDMAMKAFGTPEKPAKKKRVRKKKKK